MMTRRLLANLILLVLSVFSPLFAQSSSPHPESTDKVAVVTATQLNAEEARTKADAVLAKYVTALGGQAAMEKITSRVSKGRFELSGVSTSGPVELYAKAPNLRLVVFKLPRQQVAEDGFDGHAGWELTPDDGVKDKTGLELGSFARDSDFYQPLKLRQQYPNLFYKGTAKLELGKASGKIEDCETLVLEAPRAGSPRRFFFDSVTGLLLRTEDWNAAGKMDEATEYQDYRMVDGVKVPFIINQIENVVFTIKFTEVKHNVPIDDSIFVKPKK